MNQRKQDSTGEVGKAGRDLRTPTMKINRQADLSGFQVLRKEYSSHKFDAAITITSDVISFNSACIRFYEETNHVQILIDEKERRIGIRKCNEYDRDAMQWARFQKKDVKRVPRAIKAPDATQRLFELMGWENGSRYKMLGTRKIFENEDIVLFLMEDAERFVSDQETTADGKVIRRSRGFLPHQWRDSFGDYVEEHDRKQAVDMKKTIALFNTPDGQAYFVGKKERSPKKKE